MSEKELFGNSEQLETHDKHAETHACDLITRQDAIALLEEAESAWLRGDILLLYPVMLKGLKKLPSAQPNLSEAYSKAVFTWLMDYQIRTAELKGRYTPYEVLSWVINDWRKEHG